MDVRRKILARLISLLIISLLLVPPLSAQPCERAEASQQTCCCCCPDSGPSRSINDAEKDECSCQISEQSQKDKSSPIIVFQNDTRPVTLLPAARIGDNAEDFQGQLGGSPLEAPDRASGDRPLYILHSSFLI
ncbi:MAG: hypothetical protein GTO24_22940 [candidate division Zixibacteria bacterium]|nr:hypothetical protein [candidate division Zixibacteria bacterium]